VFDALNRHAEQPEIHALLGLRPGREAHRPKGRVGGASPHVAATESLESEE
jgi:hypothetical protein